MSSSAGAARRLCHLSSVLYRPAAAIASAAAVSVPADALPGKIVSRDMGRVDGPLSEEDLAFWAENGYVILHNAVPPQNLQAVMDDVWDFLEMDPNDPASWYKQQQVKEGERPPHGPGGTST